MSGELIDADALVAHLKEMRQRRQLGKAREKSGFRQRLALAKLERDSVFAKTGGRCHVCGGLIEGDWQADHVYAHSQGGPHLADNYLPAHALCNNYRWDYLPDEFQLILKLGVWARTQIENETALGRSLAVAFTSKERTRLGRRRRAPALRDE